MDKPITTPQRELKSTGYELFILLLSLLSIFNLLAEGILSFIFVDPLSRQVMAIIDALLSSFFIFDFGYRLLTPSGRAKYFFRNWGWADLLACFPVLRVFRMFRIVRAVHLLRRFGPRRMVDEVVNNRAGSALYITVFSLIILVELASVLVLKAEAASPGANLTTAGDAVWWVFVTVTTVGYGDYFPTTAVGRLCAVLVMFGGIALIGVLASFLASFFLASPNRPGPQAPAGSPRAQIASLMDQLAEQEHAFAALRQQLQDLQRSLPT